VTYLRQGNRDLRRSGIFVWSIPALYATLSDGTRFVTCPNAGVCGAACYATFGTYRFSNVRAAHLRNLEATFDLPRWTREMIAELEHDRYRDRWVRIHDAGDFYSRAYLLAWCEIARRTPATNFYAYTKEVALVKSLPPGLVPPNLTVIFSYGGKQDHLIDSETDRHADVFPDVETLEAAGYSDQAADDRLAVTGRPRVGIVANNLPTARRRIAGRSFSEWQETR
jgi:hypothetical protein